MESTIFRKLLLWGSLSLSLTILTPPMCRALPFQLILERMDFKPDDGTDWRPKGYFKRLIPKGPETIEESFGPIDLHGSPTPKRYAIENKGDILFPPLDLSATPAGLKSRSTFRARLELWVQNLVLTPKTFSFSGHFSYEEQSYSFEIDHIHPCYTKPTGLTLAGIIGDINTDKLLLSLNVFNVRSTEYSPNLEVDISKKLPLKNIVYSLPHTLTPFSSGSKLIFVPPKGPIVPREEVKTTFVSPYLPGIQGLELPSDHLDLKEPTHTRIIGHHSADAYNTALATGIYAKTLPQHSSRVIPVFSQDTEGFQVTFGDDTDDGASTVVGDERSGRLDFASNLDSRSTASASSSRNLEGASTQAPTEGDVYSLLGEETPVESPYLYSDGQFMYLTQTIQQECGSVASKQPSHFFKYTKILPFKVRILSNDLRLEASYKLPQGLYTLDHELWTKVDDRYLRSTSYDDYKALPPKPEGLARSIASFEKAHYPGLSQAHELLGHLRDFVQPDPSTLADDGLFQEYHRRIYSDGLLKTLTSIPEEHEHLITPLCLVVREDPKLNDPTLYKPWHGNNHFQLALDEGVCWASDSAGKYPTLRSFLDFVDKGGAVYISYLSSLVALPVFRGDRFICAFGLRKASGEDTESILTQKHYKYLARLLDLNQLTYLHFQSFSIQEPEIPLTIQPLARALAEQTVLRSFAIPRNLGFSNLTCLIRSGLVPNKSIQILSMDQIKGEILPFLIGELLSLNSTLEDLSIYPDGLNDLECLNKFGQGLEKNSSLKRLRFGLFYGVSTATTSCIRPIPGRSGFYSPVDLTVFENALVNFNGVLNLMCIGCPTLTDLFLSVKAQRDSLGKQTTSDIK